MIQTAEDKDFNTSHVTVYLLQDQVHSHSYPYFNTSHVTVYRVIEREADQTPLFQYISCYGLSLNAITYDSNYRNFNTSHVTVYQHSRVTYKPFLYNFNTSHVTVYLMILSHSYLGIFHHFLYSTSFQHFLPADYKI